MGRIEGDDIRCMYHGMKFEPGGKCIQIPGQDMIPPKLGVRSYPVVERYTLIWIWMGDVEKADPNLIVDYPPLADPKWRGLPGYMHYKANWLLIVDNLSDFAHLAFVHTHTLGGSEEYAFVTKPVAIERLPRGFRVERWHMGSEPPPFHRKVIPNKTDKVDRRNIANMHVPAIFYMETMFARLETVTEQLRIRYGGDVIRLHIPPFFATEMLLPRLPSFLPYRASTARVLGLS